MGFKITDSSQQWKRVNVSRVTALFSSFGNPEHQASYIYNRTERIFYNAFINKLI